MQRLTRIVGQITLVLGLTVVAAIGGLALFELYANLRFGAPDDDLKYDTDIYISTTYFDWVSGAPHVFGPGKHKGPIRSETIQYEDGYDYEINYHGFFTDAPLNGFPDKTENEFRIVLIGGSGAQGWGAQTVGQMLHKQLEKKLNEALAPRRINIRLINLAMAGSKVTTNSETLHGYAKHLDPDMVLAYFGVNDISGHLLTRNLKFARNTGFAPARGELPRGLQGLTNLFPTTMVKFGVAEKMREWLRIPAGQQQTTVFNPFWNSGWKDIPPNEFYNDHIIPYTADAFKSIKRDFCGLPMVLVRQIWFPPGHSSELLDSAYKLSLGDDVLSYQLWWDRLQEDLPGYLNDEWYFFDAQREIWQQVLDTASVDLENTFDRAQASQDKTFTFQWTDGKTYDANQISFGVHLDNVGHYILADWLAPKVAKVVDDTYAHSRLDLCEANFRSN
jgi:lysophospholipase L1-like esterase